MKILNKVKPLSFVIVGLTVALFSPVKAGELDKKLGSETIKHWYVGANLGQSKLEPNVTVVGGIVDDNKSNAYKVYGGYKFTNSLAIEAFYSDLGAAHIDIITDESDIDYKAFGAGLVLSLPITRKLKVQGKVGYGALKNDIKNGLAYEQIEENMVYSGLGFEYYLGGKLSWRFDYDHFDKDYQLLSTGLQFNF